MNTSHASAPALAAQHTPGPWFTDSDGDGKPFAIVTSTHDSAGPDDDVCEVYGGNCDDDATREANARLIAAAPDLLAALEAAHRSLVTCNSCHGIGTLPTASERAEIESATLLACAAIAKTTAST
jgi:hypothetical protein